ncbi:geraniol 8-hydroxylase-like [Macadamia integrifolia]|uniref:geraniol 8-hydroxylase-like n=1 Tax=Macadamia integrifolia TaxID=60698 RepID=UPI001C501473|nr:geraniol 8-hydroxylase-like [Macadamia integrifolia]
MVRQLYFKADSPIDIGEQMFVTTFKIITSMLWGDALEGETGRFTTVEVSQVMDSAVMLFGEPNIFDLFPALAWLDIQGIGLRMKKKEVMTTGSRSTSSTVEWAMVELLKRPDMMMKAQGEMEEVVGLNNTAEESRLPKLHYLCRVVKEVRLHPPAPFLIPRCPCASCTIGGFMVPKGPKVIVNAWAIQRDPIAWINPLEFQPERFLRSVDDEYEFSGKDYRHIPFGSGRRVCVGIPMAERMIPYLVATILDSFKWQLPNGVELDMSDKFGLELKKATPLVVISSSKLSDFTLYN